MEVLLGIIIIVVCCLIIWRASDGFELASQYIGRNLSDGVRGATINAIGSSIPELFTTIFFFFYYAVITNDAQDASNGFAGGIGTTAGSAIFNGMIIPAIVIIAIIAYGLASSVRVSKKVILRDGLSLIIAELILIMLISGDTLYWWHGLLLMLTYSIYVLVMLRTMSKGKTSEENFEVEENQHSFIYNLLTINLSPIFVKDRLNAQNAWLLLLVSMGIIGIACFFLVYSCEITAEGLGIETYFVAVILASAATSVPDTILSYRDAIDGQYDDAVANALGSNIFDVCFALGFPLFLFTLWHGPIQMSTETIQNVSELRIILLLLTVVAFFIYYIGKGLGRTKAILFLLTYLIFVAFIYGKAYELSWAENIGASLRNLLTVSFQ
ncbi:MAG: hypothetical protein MRY78_09175 [Saprospiraceae bacterium]|nr:hypothetical protein [Saprospiraceae bacterium]